MRAEDKIQKKWLEEKYKDRKHIFKDFPGRSIFGMMWLWKFTTALCQKETETPLCVKGSCTQAKSGK